jgi:hypothetical protein
LSYVACGIMRLVGTAELDLKLINDNNIILS